MLLAAICVLFVVAVNIAVAGYIQDDGYISFHYADNIVERGTLYYNRDAQGPYGYSNPLYILILAALRVLSLKQISFEVLSRIIASCSLAAVLFVLLRAIPQERKAWPLPYALALIVVVGTVFLFPYLLPNFFSGLETALFTGLLFLLLTSLCIHPLREPWFLVGLAMLLTLRVDAFVLLLPIMVAYVIQVPDPSRTIRLRNVALVAVCAAAFFLLQYFLTGTLLPLSFGHKSRSFSFIGFVGYTKLAAIVVSPLAILLLARDRRFARLVWFAAFYLLYISFFYGFFLIWHFERYVFPFVFAFFALLLIALFRTWPKPDPASLALLGVYVLFTFAPSAWLGFAWVSGYRVAMLNLQQIAVAFRQAQIDPAYRTYADYDAGYLSYQTGWTIIDLGGLTTPEVTHSDAAQVVAQRQPTVLIVSKGERVDPAMLRLRSPFSATVGAVPANYRFVTYVPLSNAYWWPTSHYGYYIFVNEQANSALIDGLRNISLDVEHEMGYQLFIFKCFRLLSRLQITAE